MNIQFQRPKRGREVGESSTRPKKVSRSNPPSTAQEDMFFQQLRQTSPSAVIFSSLAPNSITAPPAAVIRKLPQPLTALKKHLYSEMSPEELRAACKEVFQRITVSQEECAYLEQCTRLQSQSKLWFEHRIGRITASKFSVVARASLDSPPASLVKQLMERSRLFSSVPAIQWGIEHEDVARKAYLELAREKHINLHYTSAGLYINPSFPHLGATPDGLISCDCCGEGLIEIKCPFKHRDKHPHAVSDCKFYLKEDKTNSIRLQCTHEYFFQVQGQLAVCEKDYCDFVCWTPEGIHIERILPDSDHFSVTKPLLDAFFVKVLLPILLTGKLAQEKETSPQREELRSATQTFCWCCREEGRMVACDNSRCKMVWFHFTCVGLSRKPRGKWFCSDKCRSDL